MADADDAYGLQPLDQAAVAHGDAASLSESESGAEHDGSKKRKRPMNVTCEACKARKVRCDRAQPACGWCARNDVVCEYKERKKPGLRAGYGRELESRLDNLEALLHEQGRQLAAHLSEACTLSGGPPATLSAATALPSADVSYDNDVSHGKGRARSQQSLIDPNLSPTSRHAGTNYQPPRPTGAYQNSQVQNQYTPAALSQSLTSPHSTGALQASSNVYTDQTAVLPPYDLLYALVDLYFKHINPWLPLLDRKATLDRLFGASGLDEADRVLLHAMVAATIRFSEDARLTLESRRHFYSSSKQRVQLFALENSSVRSLQALLILALDVTGATNGPPGWNLMSLLCRSVIQLGLAAEATSTLTAPAYPSIATLRAAVLPEAKTWIEDEERRRLFWAVYLLDRYVTIATAFDFALDDKEVDRRLPCRDDLFAANKSVETRWFRSRESPRHHAPGFPDLHGHFSYHCELMGILGKIHQFLKRPVDIGSISDVEQWQSSYRSLDGELNEWNFGLPDDFVNIERMMKSQTPAKSVHSGWVMLHAAYWLTVIRLNSSAAYPAQTSAIFSSSYSAMQRCLRAVENVKHLAHYARTSNLLDKLGPPFAFSVWVCARVTLVHGSTMDHEIDPDIGFFVTVLSEMGVYWETAQRYSEILSRVLNEYQQSQRSAGMTGERMTPSTVRILADMRRCAYDLDFLITRQPHNAVRSYQPTRANSPAPNELEYLDVFDLFNFPRLPAAAEPMEGNNIQSMAQAAGPDLNAMNPTILPNFAVPNPEADWLFHTQ